MVPFRCDPDIPILKEAKAEYAVAGKFRSVA
jgi:hypothetical protein